MKKFIFLIFWLLFIAPKVSFGNFLSDPTSLDLYKKIDAWYYELELKYIEKELKGWDMNGSIQEELNKRAKANGLQECFSWDIWVSDVKKIYNDADSSNILWNILKDCFDENQAIPTETFNNYFWIVRESYLQNTQKAQTKVDNIYKIGRIWMYSDGIEENSPFDLVSDLEEINSIIFEEFIPYDWVNNFDLWRSVDGILSWLSPEEAFWLSRYDRYTNPENNSTGSGNTIPPNFSELICIDDNNNSWLNNDIFQQIINQNINSSWGTNSGSWSSESHNNEQNSKWNYAKINDNSVWPCNTFFCIMIDFVTYNHNLLWGSTNLSIEWLFKRSNTHLKKFASTSLIQAKMTTNHFEIWLKDLNLPDIFHVWIQVSYKPVPLLNVDKKETNKDDDEFKYKNLFSKYYSNLGLDFERANDLNLFSKKELEIRSWIESQELAITEFEKKFNNFYSYADEIKKQNNYISRTIVDKKVINEDIEWFYSKYIELESFTRALMEYTFWAKWIITEMNKIPQWG